jgi:uroporphyrinogen decarboxylase
VLKSLCAGLFEMAQRLRGMEELLMDLAASPAEAAHLLDRVLEVKLAYWRAALAALGDVVDVVAEGDDYGTQQSLLVSPATFRALFKPRLAELVREMKRGAPEAFVFFHSCGSVRRILPDLIEIGVEALNPVQTTAAGMEPRGLKREFGRDIAFWGGGVDPQSVLPRGTPAEVADDVRLNLDALAEGGGYLFGAVHNVQADVPAENVIAMVEALRAHGAARGGRPPVVVAEEP